MSSDDSVDGESVLPADDLLNRLVAAGVLVVDAETTLCLSDRFHETVAVTCAALAARSDDELLTIVTDLTGGEPNFDLLSPARDNLPFIATYLALGARTKLPAEERRRVVIVFDAIVGQRDPPRTDGASGPLLPVHGDRLPLLLAMYPRAVVYTWREDCPPCDAMRKVFSLDFDVPRRGIGLFAVYGPDCAALLSERFDVEGAPTTLFVVDGTVDARLLGAHESQTVRSELDLLFNS